MKSNNNNNVGQFGDTTMTKVFVGGLAWETPTDALRDHFEKYGEILEAVTFKEAEAAKKACEDSEGHIINGRRANCNLAYIGARRPRSSSPASPPPPQPQEGSNGGGPKNNASRAPVNHVQWYYPVGTPASPFHHPHAHALPFYGYAPTYVATDYSYNYNQKLSYGSGGAYMNGHHLSHVYPRQAIVGTNPLMPIYPVYQCYHPTETMGVPAQIFYPTAARHFAPVPAASGIMCKPASITPHTGASHENMSKPVNA
ncbi:RNA-binding domain superfamily [Sesbania bispinosa]|nr:RNA-binding domain superfamily [Sesbania bispinosa]